jgi:hypothetical protein
MKLSASLRSHLPGTPERVARRAAKVAFSWPLGKFVQLLPGVYLIWEAGHQPMAFNEHPAFALLAVCPTSDIPLRQFELAAEAELTKRVEVRHLPVARTLVYPLSKRQLKRHSNCTVYDVWAIDRVKGLESLLSLPAVKEALLVARPELGGAGRLKPIMDCPLSKRFLELLADDELDQVLSTQVAVKAPRGPISRPSSLSERAVVV